MKNTHHSIHQISKVLLAILLCSLLFVGVFVGVLNSPLDVRVENDATVENIASAAGSRNSVVINIADRISTTNTTSDIVLTDDELQADFDHIGSSWDPTTGTIYRGYVYTTSNAQGTDTSWTGTTWSIGSDARHSGTDFAITWLDLDIGPDWLSLADFKFEVTGTMSRSSCESSRVSIYSGTSQLDQHASANSELYDNTIRGTGYSCDTYSSEEGDATISVSINKISGRYLRIYFATCDWGGGGYGYATFSNVSIKLTRTNKSYFEGSGTSSSPFLLANREDFDYLSLIVKTGLEPDNFNDAQAVYKVSNSISNFGDGFTPIGTTNVPFKGVLDGNNSTIGNLTNM